MCCVPIGSSRRATWSTCPLVLYALRELGVNPHHAEVEPRAKQIEIANREELAPCMLWH